MAEEQSDAEPGEIQTRFNSSDLLPYAFNRPIRYINAMYDALLGCPLLS